MGSSSQTWQYRVWSPLNNPVFLEISLMQDLFIKTDRYWYIYCVDAYIIIWSKAGLEVSFRFIELAMADGQTCVLLTGARKRAHIE